MHGHAPIHLSQALPCVYVHSACGEHPEARTYVHTSSNPANGSRLELLGKNLIDLGSICGYLSCLPVQAHTTAFVDPISVEFAGVRVYEVPPNGQGIAALLALNILKELGVVDDAKKAAAAAAADKAGAGESGAATAAAGGWGGEAAYLHRLIEVLRLAFADTRWYCADMDKADVPVEELLGQRYAAERAQLFDPAR